MVDLTRDDQGRVHTRLLDVVIGRSGTVFRDWLTDRDQEFADGIEHAALDPFRGYKNAIDARLPDAVTVLDAFHVVKLGISLLDDVRRRVQNATTGHRGRKHPLYQIRRLITQGAEHLTEKGRVKLNDKLAAGDPDYEVTISWYAYHDLRAV